MTQFKIFVTFALMNLSNLTWATKCDFEMAVQYPSKTALISKQDLESVGMFIDETQHNHKIVAYVIAGFSDRSEGSDTYTQAISVARAGMVAAHLLKIKPEIKDLLSIQGAGATQATLIPKEKNRRVEIHAVCAPEPTWLPK